MQILIAHKSVKIGEFTGVGTFPSLDAQLSTAVRVSQR